MQMFQTYFRTIFKIDKKSTFICIIYNLLKQLLNVFYGVYFLRLILVHVETDRDLTAVLWVLLGMLAINVGFILATSISKMFIPLCFRQSSNSICMRRFRTGRRMCHMISIASRNF